MMYGYGFGGFWMMPFMMICIAIVVLIVVLVMRSSGNHKTLNSNKALEILDSKLASGEITEEEYQRKKQMILKG